MNEESIGSMPIDPIKNNEEDRGSIEDCTEDHEDHMKLWRLTNESALIR